MNRPCVRCGAYEGKNLERIGDHHYALCNACMVKIGSPNSYERQVERTVLGLARLTRPVAVLLGRQA